jgi:hypothetical protein
MNSIDLEDKIENTLSTLGLNQWIVLVLSRISCTLRGKTNPSLSSIEIYDLDEEGAWEAFFHKFIKIIMRTTSDPTES